MEQQAKRPRGRHWIGPTPMAGTPGLTYSIARWKCGGLVVVSALEHAKYPVGEGSGPQWHISVSFNGRRSRNHEVRQALRDFDMAGAEEDNHHPGIARHFWMAVDPAFRTGCECKETETVIREAGGYTWTNPTDAACRGCEYERDFGKPCPIHQAAAVQAQ